MAALLRTHGCHGWGCLTVAHVRGAAALGLLVQWRQALLLALLLNLCTGKRPQNRMLVRTTTRYVGTPFVCGTCAWQ